MEVFESFFCQQGKKKQKQAAISTDHPQGSLIDSSTPPLPQEQPLDLPRTLEDVPQGQDMDQPIADNS